jgi:hypothetical protein
LAIIQDFEKSFRNFNSFRNFEIFYEFLGVLGILKNISGVLGISGILQAFKEFMSDYGLIMSDYLTKWFHLFLEIFLKITRNRVGFMVTQNLCEKE